MRLITWLHQKGSTQNALRSGILTLLLMGAASLVACRTNGPLPRTGGVRMCKGTARIVSVNPFLSAARARWNGHPVTLWWDNSSILFFAGKRAPTMLAKPGQRLNFDGLLADGDIYIGRAWIGPPPPEFGGQQPFIQQGTWPQNVPVPKKLPPAKVVAPGSSAGVPQSLGP